MAQNFIDISLLGDKRLQNIFKQAPVKIQKKVLRPALRAGGKIVRNSARQKAPIETGSLKRSIKLRALPRSRSRIGVLISSDQKHYVMMEFGWQSSPTEFEAPRPFLRPALRDNEANVKGTIRREIRRKLFSELRKLRGPKT